MLVSVTEMMQKAKAGHYAVGQFNINNLEWTKAVLLTAQEQNSPVILGVSEGAGKYMTGFKTVAAMVKAMIEELNITVPTAATIPLTRTLKKRKSWLPWPTAKGSPLRLRSAPSAARRTAWSAPASAQTRRSAR